jgi:RHS repeat-associated protein
MASLRRGRLVSSHLLASPLSEVLQTTTGGVTTSYLYGVERLASRNGATRTWYIGDALGSVRRTLNDSGAVLGTTQYDPWGNVEGGAPPSPFGFTGEVQDPATGLVNLRARWYSSTRGTFTSRDPFGGFPEQPYSLHSYAYTLGNPISMTDPAGMYVAVDRGGGYDPYCQDGSRRPANGQCQYEFTADAQHTFEGGAGQVPPDPAEDWDRAITTDTKLPDPYGVFTKHPTQPQQEIFVPTDLGPGIAIQVPPLESGDIRLVTDCPDKKLLPNFVTNKQESEPGKPNSPIKEFKSLDEFKRFAQELYAGLHGAGYTDAEVFMQGSAVTGRSAETGLPFDYRRISDFDVGVVSESAFIKALDDPDAVRYYKTQPERIGPIKAGSPRAEAFGLNNLLIRLNQRYGRNVEIVLYPSPTEVYRRPSYPLSLNS